MLREKQYRPTSAGRVGDASPTTVSGDVNCPLSIGNLSAALHVLTHNSLRARRRCFTTHTATHTHRSPSHTRKRREHLLYKGERVPSSLSSSCIHHRAHTHTHAAKGPLMCYSYNSCTSKTHMNRQTVSYTMHTCIYTYHKKKKNSKYESDDSIDTTTSRQCCHLNIYYQLKTFYFHHIEDHYTLFYYLNENTKFPFFTETFKIIMNYDIWLCIQLYLVSLGLKLFMLLKFFLTKRDLNQQTI